MRAWLSLAGRLLLSGVLLAAALPKLTDPEQTVRAVRAYRLLPELTVRPFAYALPYLEVALALLLLIGIGTQVVAAAVGVLLLVFLGGVVSAWGRGLRIDCGCFGGGGVTEDPTYGLEVARDVGLLAVAALVAMTRRSAFALDNALEGEAEDHHDTHRARVASR
jgi:uncharacterized membrane protein YphA (DoxX/SURF4 family)